MGALRATIVFLIASVFVAQIAQAQCDPMPGRAARGLKTSLVRAHAPCPGLIFPAPNSMTGGGVPSCAPPQSAGLEEECVPNDCNLNPSVFQFGPNGSCDVSLKPATSSPCVTDNSLSECLSIRAKISCRDIRDADDNPATGSGWSLWTILRITSTEETVADWPGIAPLGELSDGKIAGTYEVLNAAGIGFEPCAHFEVLRLQLRDNQGSIFAAAGAGTR